MMMGSGVRATECEEYTVNIGSFYQGHSSSITVEALGVCSMLELTRKSLRRAKEKSQRGRRETSPSPGHGYSVCAQIIVVAVFLMLGTILHPLVSFMY
ncbi:unnamed protein product [Sphenostylis stenocarpa]|uniref:Uncharacterized protein n=1 Tax=Sphenostylis stenocarpa TaxID=92480 RepID=A0AA86RX37_9FABA|nr:unnamed protein product [Sphenostylis stenocarpa]